MAVITNTTTSSQFNVTAREVDFVTRFGQNWQALMEILGIMRPIRKTPGTTLRSYTASVTLQSGTVAEGDEIPLSLASVTEAYKEDVDIEKYAKAVTLESVNKWGADIAVQKTDDAFLTQLQNNVTDKFYAFAQTGTLGGYASTFQAAVAKALGLVRNKWKTMRKDITEVVVFANILDAYDYLGTANITIQNRFGILYVEDFLGARIILTSEIPSGVVIATPVENIDLYYIDPSDSEFARLGLQYTTDGVTNLIGFHAQGNYGRAMGESYALMGMKLWAEYLDGIAYVEIGATPTFTAVNKSGEGYSSKNPKTEGWYELVGTRYILSADTTVNADKTYYTKGA